MTWVGRRVGSIEILELLDSGAIGEVFVGHDLELDRKVAVKALRSDRFEETEVRRLRREARILSRLDHPNVCRIHGLVEEMGEVLLILELIDGESLRTALPRLGGLPERVRIAVQIADGLRAAHGRGIVHRDVKLENVMVQHDGAAKILDFGLARSDFPALPDRRTSRGADSGATPSGPPPEPEAANGGTGGSLAGMSPEQARGEDVSPASDVYAFGLLLQELLTGRAPYPQGLDLTDLWRRARAGETLPVTGLDPRLAALVRDCLALDPDARPSADAVAHRLRRWLDLPGLRRRRTAAAVLLLLASAGAVKYTVDLGAERNRALSARDEAQRRDAESKAVTRFLVDLFESADPGHALGEEVTARQLLDQASTELDEGLEDQPEVRVRLLETIALVSRRLGSLDRSERLLREALDVVENDRQIDPAVRGRVEVAYGDVLSRRARSEEAISWIRAGIDRLRAGAPASPDLAVALNVLGGFHLRKGEYAEALPALEEGLALRETLDGTTPSILTAGILSNLAMLHRESGDLPAATEMDRKALAVRQDLLAEGHPDLAISLNNLSIDHYLAGDLEQAEDHLRRARDIWERTLGPDHPNLATAESNLGELALTRGAVDEAEERFRRALGIWEADLGPDHPDVAYATHGLALVAARAGDPDRAREWIERTIAIRQAHLAPGHPDLVAARRDAEVIAGPSGPDRP